MSTQRFPLSALLTVFAVLTAARTAEAVQTRMIPVVANDVIYNPHDGMLYVSVPGLAPLYGNTITRVDPVSGAVGPSVAIGSEPRKLALSSDGSALWVALDGAGAIRKVDLASFTAGPQFPLGSDSFLGPYYAEDLEVIPGAPSSVVVALRNQGFSPRHMGVAVYDNGVRRPTMTPGHTGSNIIVFSGSPTRLYGQNIETTEFGFRRMDVTGAGVTVLESTPNLLGGFGGDIAFQNGRVYSTGGEVIDPEARVVLGTFPFADYSYGSAMAPDGNRAYFAVGPFFGSSDVRIQSFDTGTFTPVLAYTLAGVTGTPTVLRRWGADGLALRVDNGTLVLIDEITSPPTCDLVLSKRDDLDPVAVNDQITYRIRVENRGPAPAEAVTVRDPIPPLTSFQYASNPRGFCYDSLGTIVCTSYSSLAPGDSFEVVVSMVALAVGTVTNTATAFSSTLDDNPANNVASQTTEIRDVGFNMVDTYVAINGPTPEQAVEGQSFDVPIQYGNRGPGLATATLYVYGGSVDIEVLSGLGNCSPPYFGSFACNLGTLAPGYEAGAILRVRFLTAGAGSVYLSILASEQEANFSDNFSGFVTTIFPSTPRLLDSLAAAVSLLDLNHGHEKLLHRQIADAKASIAVRDTAGACKELEDFQEWMARWAGRSLDLDEAYALSIRTRMIQQLLGCFGPAIPPPDSTEARRRRGLTRIPESETALYTPIATPMAGATPRELQLRTGSVTTGGTAMVDMPAPGAARLELLDIQGRVVRVVFEGALPAGQHVMQLDPRGIPSGVYFYRLNALGRQKVAKVAVAR